MISEYLEARFRGGKLALGMARIYAQTMIHGAIKRCCVKQKRGVFVLQVSHLFDHVDTLRGVEHRVENAGAFQAQEHQREVDVVVAAGSGLQGIAGALFLFESLAHVAQIGPGPARPWPYRRQSTSCNSCRNRVALSVLLARVRDFM